jgi:capsular polysaccharide biosynthesis protein
VVTEAEGNIAAANGQDVVAVLRRWWWLVALALVAALAVGYLLSPAPAWSTSFRATVLIPGDTEDTGSAERPELMVLDDLGPFVESWAFAGAVTAEMGDDGSVDDVYGMIDGSRYSRVATVSVSGDDRDDVLAVANAAAEVFPDQVNAFLVAPGSGEATVQVIDPPREPVRNATMRWIRVVAIGLIGAAAAMVVIVVFSPARRPSTA